MYVWLWELSSNVYLFASLYKFLSPGYLACAHVYMSVASPDIRRDPVMYLVAIIAYSQLTL